MTPEIIAALNLVRSHGFKVLVFSPETVEGVDYDTLETALTEAYWSVLEDIGKDQEAIDQITAGTD